MDKSVKLELNGNQVVVSGPKGSISTTILDFISIENKENELVVSVQNPNDKFQKANWGTTRAILANSIVGVTTGWTKELELNGVGFKMELSGQSLTLYIGFSHPVKLTIDDNIKLTLTKNVLSGTSHDKQLLNNLFGNIHEMKPCDPYKHKGFKFPGRFYVKKVGKKGGKGK